MKLFKLTFGLLLAITTVDMDVFMEATSRAENEKAMMDYGGAWPRDLLNSRILGSIKDIATNNLAKNKKTTKKKTKTKKTTKKKKGNHIVGHDFLRKHSHHSGSFFRHHIW